MSTTTAKLDKKSVTEAVKEMYDDVATHPKQEFHFPTGRNSCLNLGYAKEELDPIPERATESFAGVGYPFQGKLIRPEQTILDIGSGSGVDAIVAAQKTGPDGKVFGIDITDAMIEKARRIIAETGIRNIEILKGHADSIPLEDQSVDVVISNGVINLVPDKMKVFEEIFRILKSGGGFQIADIVLKKPVSEKSKANAQLWAECIVGAEPVDEYTDIIRSAGFKKPSVIDRLDYFSGSSNDNTRKVAKSLGAHTVVITGQKD